MSLSVPERESRQFATLIPQAFWSSVNTVVDIVSLPQFAGGCAKAGDIVANHMIPIRIAMIAGKKIFLMIV